MAAPLIPVILFAAKRIGSVLKKLDWQRFFIIVGLMGATEFLFSKMIEQMGKTAVSLWPILVVAGVFFVIKEFIRAWVKVKKSEHENIRGKNES